MEKEKSCGAVLYKTVDGIRYYLIEKMQLGHYSLVKGHVEGNETEVETALREIKEETHLDAIIDTGFRHMITYSPKPNVIKDVIFFVGRITTEDVIAQEEEVKEIYFLKFNEALDILTYPSDKEILKLAENYLKK
jgi:tRNA nucleotidyltransferase (CCA-adding enzyme)